MAAIASAIGALAGAGINPNSIMQAGLPFAQAAQQQNYQQQNIQSYFKGEQGLQSDVQNQFTKAGLPSFMAYTGGNSGSNSLPRQEFSLGGMNRFVGGNVGANMPSTMNAMQQYYHWGNPFGSSGQFNFQGVNGSNVPRTNPIPNDARQNNTGSTFSTPDNANTRYSTRGTPAQRSTAEGTTVPGAFLNT